MFNNLSETLFGNFSFALLFFAMICYWIDTAFFDVTQSFTKQVKVNKTGFFIYSLPMGNFLKLENLATAAMVLANISLIVLLLWRWQNSGHFPLSNLYESLMFLCWSCTSIYLFILKSTYPLIKNSNPLLDANSKRQTFDLFFYKLLGSIASPCALFINAYATFSLPKEMQNAAPLVPALQSNWLMMHVTVMIISYSALMLGSLLAIAFLIVTSNLIVTSDIKQANPPAHHGVKGGGAHPIGLTLLPQAPEAGDMAVAGWATSGSGKPAQPITALPCYAKVEGPESFETTPKEDSTGGIATYPNAIVRRYAKEDKSINFVLPLLGTTTLSRIVPSQVAPDTKTIFGTQDAMQILAKNLDNLSYRVLGIGFPFLTIGILSGAVWANEAWGSYWSWDPKETWALLTWLVFAIYLHMRLSHGWQGKKPAIMASLGFLTVWFCFLGVNLLGEGLHSYGWVLN